jgi:hypothetical protein
MMQHNNYANKAGVNTPALFVAKQKIHLLPVCANFRQKNMPNFAENICEIEQNCPKSIAIWNYRAKVLYRKHDDGYRPDKRRDTVCN